MEFKFDPQILDLRTKEEKSRALYNWHEMSVPKSVHALIEAAKQWPSDTFIDIGCGTGAALEVAEEYYDNLIGVEQNQSLLVQVRAHAELVHAVAEDYALPNGMLHVYMFNPFQPQIMDQFLAENIATLYAYDSIILMNEYKPHEDVLMAYGMDIIWTNNEDLAIFGVTYRSD